MIYIFYVYYYYFFCKRLMYNKFFFFFFSGTYTFIVYSIACKWCGMWKKQNRIPNETTTMMLKRKKNTELYKIPALLSFHSLVFDGILTFFKQTISNIFGKIRCGSEVFCLVLYLFVFFSLSLALFFYSLYFYRHERSQTD